MVFRTGTATGGFALFVTLTIISGGNATTERPNCPDPVVMVSSGMSMLGSGS